MPVAGDSYVLTLKQAYLEWGTHRHTQTRGAVYGEGYLHIPAHIARQFSIFNSNQANANILYNCNSTDGYLRNETLKASGSSKAGSVYAKSLQGSGNLRLLGQWFNSVNAQVDDTVRITWISPTEIELEYLPQ